MYNTTITMVIGKYEITFSDGNSYFPSGISFNENESLDDPEFRQALKVAQIYFPEYLRITRLLLMLYHPIGQSKEEVLEEIRFAENHSYWISDEVKSKMNSEKQKRLRVSPKKNPHTPIKRDGYAYLVKSPTGAYKIGKAKNPKDRMKTFGVMLPFEVEYECLIPTEDMRQLEKDLHEKFSSKRINGEWFNLSDEDVAYIKGLQS